ncbi:MAG: flagellar biosynthesis protein FlgD [Bradyrhizobium sp.]|nr:flagellar biosynthesis protein FlgD [Bradyrhizobium sp.]
MASTGATTASPVVSGTTAQSSSSSSSSSSSMNSLANQTIAGNFQTFLTLLTTQLQNQNPLDPLDTNQFTQQLVEFAGVQQQLQTNDSLSTLVSLQQSEQASQALQYVGKTAVVSGNTAALTNSSATWELNVPSNATVNISIASSTGQTVYSGNFSANAGNNQPFTWNGQGSDGTQLPDGLYTLTATAKDSNGNNVAITTEVGGTVNSVDLTQSPPLLSINGQSYTLSQVKAIGTGSSSSGS